MLTIYFRDVCLLSVCFFKQKTAYEMRISDWSSDVCSSDLFPLLWPWHKVGPKNRSVWSFLLRQAAPPMCWRAPWVTNCQSRWEIGRASCRERVCQYV